MGTTPELRSHSAAAMSSRLPQEPVGSSFEAHSIGHPLVAVQNEQCFLGERAATTMVKPSLLSTTPSGRSAYDESRPLPRIKACDISGQVLACSSNITETSSQAKSAKGPLMLEAPSEGLQKMISFPLLDRTLPAKKRPLMHCDLGSEAMLKALDPKQPVKVQMLAASMTEARIVPLPR